MTIDQAVIYFAPSIIVFLFLEEFCQSTWEHLEGDRTAYLPPGWAHFFVVSVLQINDVQRTGRDLDFCGDCVQRKTIESLIVKLPFDEHSLKSVIPAHKDAAHTLR